VGGGTLFSEGVENLLDRWKCEFPHGSVSYADPATSFRQQVAEHFGEAVGRICGVYLIRRQHDAAILYIGKGGTVGGDGQFKGQDLPGRLRNGRGGDMGADPWFRELLVEAGPVVVEYVVLALPVAPAYVEASLLQAYLAEHGRLPPKNSML
jgi:hypothetical protein